MGDRSRWVARLRPTVPRIPPSMLHPVTVRTLALAACGWLLAVDATALTLGRARGAVLIGRPLELTIPVTLDPADGDNPCADADVFYGDVKIRAPVVRFEGGANRQGVIRLSASQPVDEPMVTVYLRAGCSQNFTRRFVMLSELPPEPETSASVFPGAPRVLPTVPRAQQAPEAAPRAMGPTGPGATAGPSTPAPTARSTRPRRDAAAAAQTPARAPSTAAIAPAAPSAAPQVREAAPSGAPFAPPSSSRRLPGSKKADGAGTGRPRLQLDILDLAPERDPTLRLSTQLSLPAATDPAARQSAAAMWQALRRTPEENLQEALKLQSLERDIQSLRSTTQQNAAAVTQMRKQVEQARQDRSRSWLLPALLAALLLLLCGLAFWLWRRGQRAGHSQWFDGRTEVSDTVLPPVVPMPDVQPQPTETPVAPPRRKPALPSRGDQGFKDSVSAAVNKPTSDWTPVEPPAAEFQASQGGTVRMVGVQELIDVYDKADFFLSIGQPEQAIATLESHVHDQVETSALAWLDLLELYHRVGLRSEFDRLRAEFIQRFTAQVPDFEHFDQPTSSLENYGRALSRIVALWPSRRVLNVIEESIFRKPGLPGADPFSLEAYRELVLLYNIAREISPPDDSLGMNLDYRPTDFPLTSLQPLSALDADRPPSIPDMLAPEGTAVMATPLVQADTAPEIDRERLMIPPSSHKVGLDIDLEESAPESSSSSSSSRELPPLDFDTSAFDGPITEDPLRKG